AIASTMALFGFYGLMPAYEVMPKARQAAMRALRLDAANAEALTTIYIVGTWYDWSWDIAEELYANVRACGAPTLLGNARVVTLSFNGRLDEALAEGRRAAEQDPLSATGQMGLQFALMHLGRYEEAEASCRRALD